METLLVEGKVSEFVEELRTRKAGKVDLVVVPDHVSMKDDNSIHATDTEGNEYAFVPTDWAHGQIAAKLRIPKPYYDRMIAQAPNLLAQNVNTWLKGGEIFDDEGVKVPNMMIRSWNGELIALVSDKYRAIDNFDVADVVIRTVYAMRQNVVDLAHGTDHLVDRGTGHTVMTAGGQQDAKWAQDTGKWASFDRARGGIAMLKAFVNDRVMNYQLVDLGVQYQPFPDKPDDIYAPGLNIRNSEVGYCAFTAEPFLWRSLCNNGAVFGFEGFRQIHIGGRKDEGKYWSDRTAQKERELILAKVGDMVNYVFAPTFYADVMERFGKLAEQKIPLKVVDASISLLGLTKDEGDDIYKKIEGNSRYDFVQAVTSKANDYLQPGKNHERGYELQKIGGKLIQNERDIWAQIDAESDKIARKGDKKA